MRKGISLRHLLKDRASEPPFKHLTNALSKPLLIHIEFFTNERYHSINGSFLPPLIVGEGIPFYSNTIGELLLSKIEVAP